MQREVHVETPFVYSSCGAWWQCIVDATIDDNLNRVDAKLQLDAVRDFETPASISDRFSDAHVMTETILSVWTAEYAVSGPMARRLTRMVMAFENRLEFENIYADEDGAPCARALRVALHTRGVNDVMLYVRMNIDCDEVFMLDVPDEVALATKVDIIWRLARRPQLHRQGRVVVGTRLT